MLSLFSIYRLYSSTLDSSGKSRTQSAQIGCRSLAGRWIGRIDDVIGRFVRREASFDFVLYLLLHHRDAVDDRTDRVAEGAASAVVGHLGQMSLRVEFDCLVAGVVAGHVTLATVDAHV